jgi:hypothetical protein
VWYLRSREEEAPLETEDMISERERVVCMGMSCEGLGMGRAMGELADDTADNCGGIVFR